MLLQKGTLQGHVYTRQLNLSLRPGGDADPSNGMSHLLRPDVGPKQGVANGEVEAREAVRARYQDGADLIKITATGGGVERS